MNTLNQESKTENIVLTGTVEGANVKMTYVRENEKTLRQITVHAESPVAGGVPAILHIDYNPGNRSIGINMYNIEIDSVPLLLMERMLEEMQAVNREETQGE